MPEDFSKLTTEGRSIYNNLDAMSITEILQTINQEDYQVPKAIEREIPNIAAAIDLILLRLKNGGKLFYIGAGTSGRLGVLDASECPPTFGVTPTLVQGIIAGGDTALRSSLEGIEDNEEAGSADLAERGCSNKDAVVAIAASGRTPYCMGALRYAKSVAAACVALVCNENSPMAQIADVAIAPIVGPEVLTGSTRMKAGTAQKLVLNMLSTTTMISLGKAYSNLMIDLNPANSKLKDRSVRVVMSAAGVEAEVAQEALQLCDWSAKQATVVILTGCTPKRAQELLSLANGFVRRAIEIAT